MSHLFGTDGVRGHANRSPMTVETALAIGRAAGKLFRRHAGRHRVVIGKDTRLSCYMFESALISGLCSMGVDTLTVGPLPTPGVAYLTRAYRADAGIVISASHNPFHDNGIKFFSRDGYKLDDVLEEQIENEVQRNSFFNDLPADEALGRHQEIVGAQARYVEFVKSSFPRYLSLEGISIGLDCAHGAAYTVGPMLFRELGAEVHAIGIQPNGVNINLQCGALHPKKLQELVVEKGCRLGIAFDGDGDRAILVDERGEIVDGDAILAICAYDLKQREQLPGDRVVGTVMTNYGMICSLRRLGIDVVQAPVGDRHVLHEMLTSGSTLGGEQSGHTIFLNYNTTGDGLIAALQVVRIMLERQVPLSELAAIVERFPQVLRNVHVTSKPLLDSLSRLQLALREAEGRLGEAGRVLIRYSGTENLCRVMVEGRDVRLVEELAGRLEGVVREEIG
jgi:phosphoglucosamine mutase